MPSPHILTLDRHRLCISLPFWCVVLLIITGKRLTSFSCSSLPSSPVRLYGICCRSGLWVFSCSVDSHGIVGCSSQYWQVLFFLRFQLMFGTASLWLGQSLVVFYVVFIVVGLPSIVSLFVLVFKIYFLVFWFICSLLYLEDGSIVCWFRFVSLSLSILASLCCFHRISGGSSFHHVCHFRFG